jgi:hypothetical protein
MRIAGFGCIGCGALFALLGIVVIIAAFVPGVVNGSETGTAISIGGSACGASFMPLLVGTILVIVGGKKDPPEG